MADTVPVTLPKRNVIIYVADGLRNGSINAIDTPTMFGLRQTGVNFNNSYSLFPTFTTPNASAIATGHYLGDTGDFSNTVYTGYPVINANGSVTPFIENDPILADINANSNRADPDTSFSNGNFLTEETLLAYARTQGYATAAIGKLGPVAIFDPTQDVRTGGATTANITPKTVIVDDSTYINSIANATSPPVNAVGSQSGIPLSTTIANDLNKAGLIGINIPGTSSPATTIGSLRSNQPSGNLTTAGTLNSNAQQQHYFADATTKAILPQFVSDIAGKTANGFAAVYWSRDPDGTQHNNGDAFNAADPGNNSLTIGINGPTAKKGVNTADTNLKQIIDYLQATDDPANPGKKLYDNTDIFVTADHGFSTISKQAIGVTFAADGAPTYIPTKSYAATLDYSTVHKGFLPPGFVAIDLAKDLGSTLYDPNKPTAPVTLANINDIQYTAIDPTKGQLTTSGNGVIGGSGKVLNGTIDAGTKVVVAANGGSDLLYVPSNDPALVKQIVALLSQKDYISGIFTDDKFGDIPGALKLSSINLKGNAELATPSIVINFKSFSTNPNDPNDALTQVEVADTTLQQGQGMHGSFGSGDTFNNMIAVGPDFKSGYVDNAPVSNVDVVPTLASILGWTLPSAGTLIGRAVTEALVGGPATVPFTTDVITSATAASGTQTILNTQSIGNTTYFAAAGTAGGTDGLITTAPTTVIAGTVQDDIKIVSTRNNIIFTGGGNDLVDSSVSKGNNRIYGGDGNDELYASTGDRLFGEAGDDILDASLGKGGNRLYGGAGNDTLFAGTNDFLYGGDGNDTLYAGKGGNTLYGGAGADKFYLAYDGAPTSVNTVADFETGIDSLLILGIASATSFSQVSLTQQGADTLIKAGGKDLALLTGIQSNTLTSSSFKFTA
jgi:arylsulfatase A-like enzyme